jgi:uncharacterized protein (TIGR00290 family)
MSRRVLLSWSSGKDSAWTLHTLRKDRAVEVIGLLTTINTTHQRVAMHSTRLAIVEAQARAAGLPLHVVPLPWPCSNDAYERALRAAIDDGVRSGATHIAFGDLFLEDIRAYRVTQLEGSGLEPLFPIWREPTGPLARRMIDAGVEAVLTCVDPRKLPRSFAGRTFDHDLLDDLPSGVDPCGENGEFHTCVLGGPMFREPIGASVGEVVERDGFCFADLIPTGSSRFSTVTCVPVYSARHGLSTQVPVGLDEGLRHESSVHCDELVSLPKSWLTSRVGNLAPRKVVELDRALVAALGIDVTRLGNGAHGPV